MSGKRKTEISLMNVTLCIFVIIIHAVSALLWRMDVNSWQYMVIISVWRLCACAVPGFFFLSALKLSLTANREGFSYPKYIMSRIKRVWLPYFLTVVVYFLFFVCCNYMKFDIPEALKLLFDGNMCAHFYFVITVMQFYLLAPLWRKLAKMFDEPFYAVIAVVLALFVGLLFGQYLVDVIYIFYKDKIFPYSDRIFTTYIFWWIAGLAVGRHYEKIKTLLSKRLISVSVIFAFSAVHNAFLTYMHNSGKAGVYWLETAHSFYVVCAILFMLALFTRLSDTKLAKSAVVGYIDRASYSIYLWHPLALYICDIAIGAATLSLSAYLGLRLLFSLVGTVAVCVAVAVAVEHIRRKLKTK